MKIGVLTYHCVPNFGAQLQAMSTVGYLKRSGHEPVILHWYPKDLEDMYIHRISTEQLSAHISFTNRYLPVSEICRTEGDLARTIDNLNLDAIIVGSDALFKYIPQCRRRIFSRRDLRYINKEVLSIEDLEGNPFFGEFVDRLKKKIPVAAFSVSSQNCPYYLMNKEEFSIMKKSLLNYKKITVRDQWTKDMVENVTGLENIQITPDPVFSFNQNCRELIPPKELIFKKYGIKKDYVLLSFSKHYSNSHYIFELSKEAENRGYQAIAFPMPEILVDAGIESQISLPLDPLDWYALIKYSSGYIGERMHPIVVCLHNSVPFFSFDEYGTVRSSFWGLKKELLLNSSKTYQIIKRANLMDCYFNYKNTEKLPLAYTVIGCIQNFNRCKCENWSLDCQKQYETGMKFILSSF